MKKLFLLSLFALLALVTQNTQADFGSSFGGSFAGSMVGSAIGNAASQPRTVVVRESDDYEPKSSRKHKRKLQDLEDENDDLRRRLEKLENAQQ